MIIAKITQNDLELTVQEINIPYQHSQGLEIQFVRDEKFKDYTLLSFYKLEGDIEAKLMEHNNDIISIAKDVFKKIGKVSFSFSLTSGEEVIHLGVVEFYVRRAFGNDESILPQDDKNTWIDLIGNVAKDGVDNYWNSFYKEQIDSIVRDINSKVSDASNYANQANTAKVEAQQCATDAGNSATSALDNANKAQQHLNSIVEKTAAFNADYTEKVNSFNSNVENANNALDKKILDANTDIDKKVLDANTNLDTKITDANTSIDAKVTEATTQADIATSKATELSQAVDKVKYLEDVVDTKLTQPYVSSGNIENATISDSDEGQLRNLRIYGKCTQKVETDIVPTPERPVPIVSKKIVVDGEVVELGSLKETINLFDSVLCGFEVGLLNNNGILQPGFTTYFTSGYIPIKKSTQYMVGILGLDGYTLTGVFFYDQNYNLVAKTDSKPFTTPANSMYVKFGCTKNGGAVDEINKHAMLVEGATVPSAYVAPTVRDYKIVDHVNKKSWIERNIQEVNLNNLNFVYSDTKTDYTRFYAPLNPTIKYANEIYSNSFPSYKSYDYTKEAIYGGNTSGGKTLSVIVKDSNVAEHTKEALLNYINNPNAVAYYALETPIIEEIPYVESDISEFGVSSQDSISPSPTIPSELEFVNKIENEEISKIEIKTVGINLLSNKLEHWYFRKALGWGASTGTPVPKPNTFSNVGYSAVIEVNGILPNTKYSFYNADTKNLWVSRIIEMDSDYIGCCNHRLYDNVETDNKEFYAFTTSVHTTKLFLQIRTCPITRNRASRDIEEKDIANMQITLTLDEVKKHYNYLETVVSHTLANPLLSIKEYRDTIDLNTEERKNYIYELPKELITTDVVSIYKKSNNCIRFGIYNSRFIPHMLRDTEAVICNMFKTLKAPWSLDVESIHVHDDYLFHFYISVNKNRLTGYNDNLTDAEIINLFKEFIQNADIRIWWVLAEPTVEPLDPELVEKLKTLKTFYPITHIISNVPLEFAYKLNMPAWHKVVSGQVEDARDVIYNMQVQQNNLEVMQLQSALETQYNLDLLKLGGNLC